MLNNKIIFFDGDCGYCNNTIIKFASIDKKNEFLFISNKSEKAKLILKTNNFENILNNTIILYYNNKFYYRTEAVFKFLIINNYYKSLFLILDKIPYFITNLVYDFISNNRNKIKTNCKVPNKSIAIKIINN
jgi:predicted DCC family thiol-disulfide oxidoreductase YuxK